MAGTRKYVEPRYGQTKESYPISEAHLNEAFAKLSQVVKLRKRRPPRASLRSSLISVETLVVNEANFKASGGGEATSKAGAYGCQGILAQKLCDPHLKAKILF